MIENMQHGHIIIVIIFVVIHILAIYEQYTFEGHRPSSAIVMCV